MRLYTFNNMYLSSLQIGLQSAHVVHEIFLSHPNHELLWDWAEHHKTMILLNGGYAENLLRIAQMFEHPQNNYPFAKFHEEEAALNGAVTSVGIVLPEKVYQGANEVRMGNTSIDALQDVGHLRLYNDSGNPDEDILYVYNKFDVIMIDLLSTHNLAH